MNFNFKAYREKLFGIAKKKKTEEIARKDLYDVIEIFDSTLDMDQEEERYNAFIQLKQEKKAEKQNKTSAVEETPKEESKVDKKKKKKEKEPIVPEEKEEEPAATAIVSKKKKLNDATSKNAKP